MRIFWAELNPFGRLKLAIAALAHGLMLPSSVEPVNQPAMQVIGRGRVIGYAPSHPNSLVAFFEDV